MTAAVRPVTGAHERLTCLVRNGHNDLEAIGPEGLNTLGERIHGSGELVWLDIDTPSSADVELLRREVGAHPLAVEDLERRNQRPKIDAYADHHVIVTYDVRPPAVVENRFELAETHLFVGPSFLVSVHWGPSPALAATLERFRANTGSIDSGVGALLYAILDAVGDAYFPVIDGFAEDLDELLDRIIEQPSSKTLHEVIRARRRLLELRRVLAPQREVANILLRREIGFLEEEAEPYFQDLYDHLIRLLESVDLYRDLLAGALDAQISVTSNSLNAIMKRLTAFTVLLMVPTLIAGVYGMNFDLMPELRWAAGYPFALGLMIVSMTAIGIFFWRHRWF
ncbi:MAG: magnesium/cobalt transporter CorA [Candidatus Limnocylindria bacterium]